jgi:hypothetical protein
MTTTNNLAWIEFGNGAPILFTIQSTDGTPVEMTSFIGTNGVGVFENQILTGLKVQCGDGSVLNSISVIASDGGTQVAFSGNERAVSSASPMYNLEVSGLNIKVEKGMALNILTAD